MYNKFAFLSIVKKFLKKIIMNFVIDLPLNKRKKIVYNFIFVIVNCCIKIIRYILTIIKYDIAELTKKFFIEIIFKFDMFNNIVNNKKFVFIFVFCFFVCYYFKIKRRLNIVFYF